MDAAVSAVLFAVANGLAQTAKDSLPELRDGERIKREWFSDGVYYRETVFDGEIFTSQYDFRRFGCGKPVCQKWRGVLQTKVKP